MPGSTIGGIFRVTTFGESHGAGVGAVVDGVPPGLPLSEEDIQKELDRRRPGQSAVTSPRRESDQVEILSGVFEGSTTGTPVALLIRNRDVDSSDYRRFKDKLRPGHADHAYLAKYGLRDWRGSGRASGRETAARVAAGAVARKLLEARGIAIAGYAAEIGGVAAGARDLQAVERNPVRSPDPEAAARMVERIERAREEQDSVGGVVEVVVRGLPPGLGEPVFNKLEARLATR
jgi:chorismate synthase